MTSTTEVVEETTTKFNVGDRVQVVDHHSIGGTSGTVTKVRTEPDKEPVYTIRVVRDDNDYERLVEGDLEPDEHGFIDLNEIGQVLQELRDVVNLGDEYSGLDSPVRSFRLMTLARIGFLASRAAWLETVEQNREEMERMPAAARPSPSHL